MARSANLFKFSLESMTFQFKTMRKNQRHNIWNYGLKWYFCMNILCFSHLLSLSPIITDAGLASSVFGKSRKEGASAEKASLHPRRAPYGRHWRDFSQGLFLQLHFPCKHMDGEFSEGLFIGGGRLTAPEGALQLHFPVNTFAIRDRTEQS